MVSIETILNSTENDYIDFKQEWYKPDEFKCDMVHDILCLANSLTNSPERYIVIGISETKRTKQKNFHNIRKDPNAKTSENIIDKLRDCMLVPPKIEVIPITFNRHYIEVIKITPVNRNLPYVLTKDCHNPNKKKTIQKNIVYTRNSSQNAPVCEQCAMSEIEELFARKRGEDLSIEERYSLYLDDTENWIKTANNYYYSKNHNFKIVCKYSEENTRYFNKVEDYHQILVDTCISKDYWDNKSLNYDDYYLWYDVELYANNTLIKTTTIMEFFAKYFFADKGLKHDTYYIPLRDNLKIHYDPMKTKNDILATFEWKLCKIFFKCNNPIELNYDTNAANQILDHLNYEFLEKGYKYIEENKNWIYDNPQDSLRK